MFPEKFLFCTDTTGSIGWPSPATRLHIGVCFKIHNFSLRTLWICCYQVTKIFCTRYGSAIASSARGPCNFGPLTDFAISVFRDISINTVLTKNLTSLECGLSRYFMRRTGVWVSAFRNFIIHQIFPEFLQPLQDFRTCATWVRLVKLLVIGFTADNGLPRSIINIETGHRHWRGITFSSILSFSSLIITWCCCRWWRRRAWRRCRTMPLLSWRRPWSWMIRTEGRTRWQAWNHDRNEVLRVALYPSPVFNEMRFFGPLIHSKEYPFFIAKLSKRQYCWRVFEDFHSQEYIQFFDVNCGLFMNKHFTIGCYDRRRTARFRQSIHFSITQVPFCWSYALTHRSRQQILVSSGLRFDASKHLFSGGEKNVALSCSFNFNTFLASFHATLCPPETDPQILERWGYADEVHLGKSIRAKDFCLEFWCDVQYLSWISHVGLVSACLSSSVRLTSPSAAPCPQKRNPIVVY